MLSFQDYSFVSEDIDRRYMHLYTKVYHKRLQSDGTYTTKTDNYPMKKCKKEWMVSQFMRDAYEE